MGTGGGAGVSPLALPLLPRTRPPHPHLLLAHPPRDPPRELGLQPAGDPLSVPTVLDRPPRGGCGRAPQHLLCRAPRPVSRPRRPSPRPARRKTEPRPQPLAAPPR